MQASDLGIALLVISRFYPDARVVPAENREPGFIVIECPGYTSMPLASDLESVMHKIGFKYSDSHGACWYIKLGEG